VATLLPLLTQVLLAVRLLGRLHGITELGGRVTGLHLTVDLHHVSTPSTGAGAQLAALATLTSCLRRPSHHSGVVVLAAVAVLASGQILTGRHFYFTQR
jgi:hypothetical protein